MNNPDYISFDFVDNISDYIRNYLMNNNTFSKLKSSKSLIPVSKYYYFRDKIMNEFCYNIVNQYSSLWVKKSVVLDLLSTYEDMVMDSEMFNDEIKDNICKYINNQRIKLIERYNL